MDELQNLLAVDKAAVRPSKVWPARHARIQEAISWAKGTQDQKVYTTLWEEGDFRVALGKPGKEASPTFPKVNVNDMRPTIFFKGKDMGKFATFQEIVKNLEEVGKSHPHGLELLGCLLFRSAFLLDHKPITLQDGTTVYRYSPSDKVIKEISDEMPLIYGIPPKVFLHYLDAIALNEDVKYHTLGYNLERKAVGARNNMLTYVNLIAIISGKKPLHTLTGPLLRSGVSAITLTAAMDSLPYLKRVKKEEQKEKIVGKRRGKSSKTK